MRVTHDPKQNHLLAALPEAEWAHIGSHLELVEMSQGQVLYESGAELRYVYFPTTSIVSLLYTLEDGASPEIAVVGKEGIIGIALCTGQESTPSRAVVQSAGHGYRLKASYLKQATNRSAAVLNMLLQYTQLLIMQIAQTAVANRHHSIDQQVCRRLLLSLDRLSSNEMTMTHELIASMLGVRREGVTMVAKKLKEAGLIQYSRGHIKVIDRSGLEARASECY